MLLLAAALTLVETIALQGPLHHVQGIDVEGEILWVTSVDRAAKKGYLYKLNLHTGKVLESAEVQNGDRYHPGGLTLDGDYLWVPVAEYRRDSSAWIQRRDKRTLRLLEQFEVQDHIGCVAASNGRLYGGNWDSRFIYEWDKKGRQKSKTANIEGAAYQDLKLLDDRLVGGGIRGKKQGVIDWLHPETLRLMRRTEVGVTDRNVMYTHEGMTMRGGLLYLLPEDEADGKPSRLFVFKLP